MLTCAGYRIEVKKNDVRGIIIFGVCQQKIANKEEVAYCESLRRKCFDKTKHIVEINKLRYETLFDAKKFDSFLKEGEVNIKSVTLN